MTERRRRGAHICQVLQLPGAGRGAGVAPASARCCSDRVQGAARQEAMLVLACPQAHLSHSADSLPQWHSQWPK